MSLRTPKKTFKQQGTKIIYTWKTKNTVWNTIRKIIDAGARKEKHDVQTNTVN